MNLKQLLNLREQAYKLRTEDKLEDSLEKYKEISTSSIQHENNQTFFFISEAKFNIATILEDLKKLDEAKDIYIGLIDRLKSGVDNFNKEKDLMELYAKVLINLGGLNFDGNFFLEASRIYNCVQKKYSKDCYANSRVQLGNINYILDMKEKAIGYYTQVEKTDSLRQYSRAQYGLGVIAQENNNLDRALDFYENVHNCAPAEIFYDAKNKAGQINYILNKYKEAKGFFSFIDEKSGIDIYGSSLFYLGKMSESTDEKNKYFERIDEKSQVFQQREYEINLVKKISLLEMDSIKNCFNNILDMVDIILEHLFISSESERLLAHYTNLTVSKLLLSCH